MANRALDQKAQQARRKKLVLVLGLVFVAVLAFQVPRTLKVLHGSSPAQATSAAARMPATTSTSTMTPAPAAAPHTAVAVQVASASSDADTMVVNADLQPAPLEGQLVDLTTFQSKDPFVQQESASTAPAAAAPTAAKPAVTANTKSAAPQRVVAARQPTTSPVMAAPQTSGTPPATAAPRVPAPAAPTPAPAPTSGVLSVNGVQEAVNVGSDFPAADPLFHLVSLTTKSGKISIAGGTLATGAATITIQLGKPTTLMNTADGTRYVIELVSIGASAAG